MLKSILIDLSQIKTNDHLNHIQDEVNKAIAQMKGVPNAAKAHLKDVGLDVAEILLKRGVPVKAGTIAGILATAVSGPTCMK